MSAFSITPWESRLWMKDLSKMHKEEHQCRVNHIKSVSTRAAVTETSSARMVLFLHPSRFLAAAVPAQDLPFWYCCASNTAWVWGLQSLIRETWWRGNVGSNLTAHGQHWTKSSYLSKTSERRRIASCCDERIRRGFLQMSGGLLKRWVLFGTVL